MVFDSRREARRYTELKSLERAGKIKDLNMQVPFELIPAQRESDTIGKRGGKIKGKVLERAIVYKADFTYYELVDDTWKYVVEDVKGVKTKDYILKRKMMLFFHGIRIKEV
jgi:hypothetical protein